LGEAFNREGFEILAGGLKNHAVFRFGGPTFLKGLWKTFQGWSDSTNGGLRVLYSHRGVGTIGGHYTGSPGGTNPLRKRGEIRALFRARQGPTIGRLRELPQW